MQSSAEKTQRFFEKMNQQEALRRAAKIIERDVRMWLRFKIVMGVAFALGVLTTFFIFTL